MTVGRRRGRILAFQALYAWDVSGLPPENFLEFYWIELLHEKHPSPEMLVFPRLLFLGTVEHISEVDVYIANHLQNWDFSRLNLVDKAILRLSVYSLLFQKDTPANVVIDEAINIAKDYGTDDSFKFVNAVLDSIRKTV